MRKKRIAQGCLWQVGIGGLWCILWLPIGWLFPLKVHGGVAGWYAPFIGWLAIPFLWQPQKEGGMGRLDIFINFILPFFLFWLGFLLLPWLVRSLVHRIRSGPQETVEESPQ